MAYGFGCWEPVPKDDTLVNRVSGQRVRRLGPTRLDDDPESEGWLRFEYEDDEVSFSILARLRWGDFRHPIHTLPYSREGRILSVDYNRSADLWRQQGGSAAAHPSYGLWRRVDDCLMDALACWPRMKSRDRALGQIRLLGGWLNGEWRRELHRTLPALTPLVRKYIAAGHHVFKAEGPVLFPLGQAPPSPWRFHPHPTETPSSEVSAWLEFGDTRLRPTIQVFDPPEPEGYQIVQRDQPPPKSKTPGHYNRWIVPAGEALRGIVGRKICMRSEDESRILYPDYATNSDEERAPVRFSIEYADRDIDFLIAARNESLDPRTDWIFDMQSLWGGARREDDRFTYRVHYLPLVHQVSWGWSPQAPTYALWRRLLTELMDAWLHWEGTSFRLQRWDPTLALAGTASVTFRHHYLGGIWPAGEYCTARLLDDGEASEGAPV